MTYEEFKELIEKTGEYQVSDGRGAVRVFHQGKKVICYISKTRLFGINTIFSENEDFFKECLDTIIEFAKTPIGDRYPVKKYYVKLDLPEFIYMQKRYLNKVNYAAFPAINYKFDSQFQDSNHQTQFTMEEIKEIILKEDMEKFQFISVEEEE